MAQIRFELPEEERKLLAQAAERSGAQSAGEYVKGMALAAAEQERRRLEFDRQTQRLQAALGRKWSARPSFYGGSWRRQYDRGTIRVTAVGLEYEWLPEDPDGRPLCRPPGSAAAVYVTPFEAAVAGGQWAQRCGWEDAAP